MVCLYGGVVAKARELMLGGVVSIHRYLGGPS